MLADLGYSFRVESSKLPRKEIDDGDLDEARRRLEKVLPRLSLTTEAARRGVPDRSRPDGGRAAD